MLEDYDGVLTDYVTIGTDNDGVLFCQKAIIKDYDAVAKDCDGVLTDYDEAIFDLKGGKQRIGKSVKVMGGHGNNSLCHQISVDSIIC